MLLPHAVDFCVQFTWTVDGDFRQAGKLQKVAKETLFIAVEGNILSGNFSTLVYRCWKNQYPRL